ncbi:hypothetical protein ANN_01129 [Periplaneta americana]|uniref:Uncharacterized protein n=1 Tax=Periplaneta americana TaxID=6978 RepID=A0ABQ8TSR4_PERAM|nr:hypothetical protein ANN_01129 [Periplaneta americana]
MESVRTNMVQILEADDDDDDDDDDDFSFSYGENDRNLSSTFELMTERPLSNAQLVSILNSSDSEEFVLEFEDNHGVGYSIATIANHDDNMFEMSTNRHFMTRYVKEECLFWKYLN